MDDKLNFDVHVPNKISKCNKIIGIVTCLSIILPRDATLTLYKILIRPQIDYADIKYDKPNNELFQKKIKILIACLAIAEATQGNSQEKLYQELELESLSDRQWCRNLFFYKMKNKLSPTFLIFICIITI